MKKAIVMLIILCFPIYVLAEEHKELQIVNSSSETKYLENDQGYITKNIIASDAKNGEVTIELKLSNMKKETEKNKTTEIFLVLDNSLSMDYNSTETSTRKDLVVNATTNIINKIYDKTSNVKVGVVRFASKWNGTEATTGKEYYQPNAANLMSDLTNNKELILNSITNYKNMETEAGTNIYAGLKKAYQNFSKESNNKIIILITDGIPTEYTESYTDYASDTTVYNNTKDYIEEIGKEVTLISLMTGISEDAADNDDIEVIEQIFGASENPTSGYFYNISDADIESVVNNDIFANVMEKVQNPINTVKIVDYFPNDITENFEFSYVGDVSIGTISQEIDKETKSISWDIGTLKGNEVATIKYKLKLKDMNTETLLNKVINTNEKVVLDYSDGEDNTYNVVLDSSPSIKLINIEDIVNYEDETTENPKTGLKDYMIIITSLLICTGIILYKVKKKKYITNI